MEKIILYIIKFLNLYLISDNNQLNIHVKYIITDNESALIKGIKTIFPKIINILCFYHYKKDLLFNIEQYGLYKKKIKLFQI